MEPRLKKLRATSVMPKKLRWGVVGCGHFLETTFLPTFQHLKKSKLVSVYSSNISRANFIANKFNASTGFDNYTDFLNSEIDAVYISSKNSDHYWQVIEAAKAGKNILCEKPLALTAKEADKMVDICNKKNVKLTINYVLRYHPIIKKTKELIESNLLGKLISISSNFNIDFKPDDNFRFIRAHSGGGALRDLGTHTIDMLRYLGGEITDINGVMDNVIFSGEVEDFASAIVKFENGGYGSFNVSYNVKNPHNRIEILGHNGVILIENLIAGKNSSAKMTIHLKDETKRAFRRRANKQLYLLRSVQKSFSKDKPLLVTGYDGLVNMHLMEELEKKARG